MSDIGTMASNSFSFTNNLLANSSIIFIVAIIIILYVLLGGASSSSSSSYNSFESNDSSDSLGSNIIGSIIAVILLLIIFIIIIKLLFGFDIIKYFYNFDIYEYLYNLFYPKPPLPLPSPDLRLIPDLTLRKEVFNIPQNTYVYDDAKAVCNAYGARLATYKEVEDSYESGGEWCNYGWSEGQMALFPTQEETYDKLQTIKGHENDCGRTGVNGGFIANPNLRFGVNCYGKKPQMTPQEEELMATQPIYPRTVDEIELENRVKYWKDKLSSVIVSPFNHETWSKF